MQFIAVFIILLTVWTPLRPRILQGEACSKIVFFLVPPRCRSRTKPKTSFRDGIRTFANAHAQNASGTGPPPWQRDLPWVICKPVVGVSAPQGLSSDWVHLALWEIRIWKQKYREKSHDRLEGLNTVAEDAMFVFPWLLSVTGDHS